MGYFLLIRRAGRQKINGPDQAGQGRLKIKTDRFICKGVVL